jgi:hypothetical protein
MDQNLVDSLAYVDSLEKLVESKKEQYLDSDRIFNSLNIEFQDVGKLMAQSSIHGSYAFYFSTLAARLTRLLNNFEETTLATYLAHCRYYGSLYCEHLNKKDTKEAIADCVILLFTGTNSKEKKVKYSALCFDNFKKQAIGKEFDTYKASESYSKDLYTFYQEMYKYDGQNKSYEWFYEQKALLEERKQIAEGLMNALKCSSIAASNIFSIMREGSNSGNAGKYVVQDSLIEQSKINSLVTK